MDERGVDKDMEQWRPWIDEVCQAVDVDSAEVDVPAILDLAGTVSREFLRPMAPVSTYPWGLAMAAHPEADPAGLREAILQAMPADEAEDA